MTVPLLVPFRGMFPSPVTEEGFVLEFSTLIAIVIYALLAWVILQIIRLISEASAPEARHSGDENNEHK
jgi:hypothetical protein